MYNNNTAVTVQIIEEMAGMPFALRFFDDDNTLYVSREVFEKIGKKDTQVRYMVMAWRKNQITIHEAVKIIIERIVEYGKETEQIN